MGISSCKLVIVLKKMSNVLNDEKCDPPSLRYGRAGARDDAMKYKSWYQKIKTNFLKNNGKFRNTSI